MPRSDDRMARTGRHPDLGGHVSNRALYLRQRDVKQEVRELERTAQGLGEADPSTRPRPLPPDDAARTLGLDAERTRMASRLIGQVAKDARDMLVVAKAAREAGISPPATQALIRAGLELWTANRRDAMTKAAGAVGEPKGLPEGTVRQWGDRKVQKKHGTWVDMATGKPASDPGDEGQKPPGKGQQTPQSPPKEVDPHVRARFQDIRQRANKVGLKIKGALHPSHTHAHIDRLEAKVSEHEKAAGTVAATKEHQQARAAVEGGEGPPPGAAAGVGDGRPAAGEGSPAASRHPYPGLDKLETAHPKSPEAAIPRDSQGRPIGTDAPGKTEPHEVHRLQVQIDEMTTRLKAIEAHLDSPALRAMQKQLMDEGAQVRKKPSYQGSEWFKHRSLSFLAMVTGAVVGGALAPAVGAGAVGGAMAGGVEGKASKIEPGEAQRVMEQGQKAQEKKEAKPPPQPAQGKPDAPAEPAKPAKPAEPPDLKKAQLVLIGGKLWLRKGRQAQAAGESRAEPFRRLSEDQLRRVAREAHPELIPGGEASGKAPAEFDPTQLEIGTTIEMEHATDRAIAREIAMDHLTEDPAYYTKLARIEKSDHAPTGGGWHPVPGGSRGGMRRRTGRGWEYWYPGDVNPQASQGRHRVLDRKQLEHVLQHGSYSVISAGRNPADPKEAALPEDHPTFAARHEQLKQDVRRAGMHYTEVEGHYGGREHSLVVFHDPEKIGKRKGKGKDALMVHHDHPTRSDFAKVRELGAKYNQDSVVHSRNGQHELHYTAGPKKGQHVKGAGHEFKPTADDFYTDVETKDGDHSKFALNFDWGAEHPMDAAVLKSREIDYTLRDDLRALVKSHGVLVTADGDGVTLTGNLGAAGVPAVMLPFQDAGYAVLDKDTGLELVRQLRRS